ncbi:MAG: hypothetical protein U1G05_17280 [Kiritimatiellia bacterium]
MEAGGADQGDVRPQPVQRVQGEGTDQGAADRPPLAPQHDQPGGEAIVAGDQRERIGDEGEVRPLAQQQAGFQAGRTAVDKHGRARGNALRDPGRDAPLGPGARAGLLAERRFLRPVVRQEDAAMHAPHQVVPVEQAQIPPQGGRGDGEGVRQFTHVQAAAFAQQGEDSGLTFVSEHER